MATSTSTTRVKPTKQQKKLSKLSTQAYKEAAASGIEAPEGGSAQYIAPVAAEQTAGQNQVLSASAPTGSMQQIADQATQASQFLSGDVLSPDSNPYMREYGNYLATDLGNQFAQTVLPNIRSGASGAGQFGSSRHGIAEGLAAEGLARQTGGALADFYSKGYGQGLEAHTRGLALAPQTAALQLAPGLATSGVGDVRRALAQEPMTADLSDYYLNMMGPWMEASQLASGAGSLPGGATTTTTSYPGPTTNPVMAGLGGAAAGASLGASVGGPYGAVGGAGLGALLAFI